MWFERYLFVEDFLRVFVMFFEEFGKLVLWKWNELRRRFFFFDGFYLFWDGFFIFVVLGFFFF